MLKTLLALFLLIGVVFSADTVSYLSQKSAAIYTDGAKTMDISLLNNVEGNSLSTASSISKDQTGGQELTGCGADILDARICMRLTPTQSTTTDIGGTISGADLTFKSDIAALSGGAQLGGGAESALPDIELTGTKIWLPSTIDILTPVFSVQDKDVLAFKSSEGNATLAACDKMGGKWQADGCHQTIQTTVQIGETTSQKTVWGWQKYDPAMPLDAGTDYYVALDYHRNVLKGIDLVPQIGGNDLSQWVWWNVNWEYVIPCIVNTTVDAPLSNFPARCDFNTSNSTLWNTTTCANVRFLNGSNTTVLSYDIDSTSPAFCGNASQNTTFWIGANTTSQLLNENTIIYAYLGNVNHATNGEDAQTMWRNAGYVAVYHMNQNDTLVDEAGYANLAITTSGTSNATYIPHGIGFSVSFDGATKYEATGLTHLPTNQNPYASFSLIQVKNPTVQDYHYNGFGGGTGEREEWNNHGSAGAFAWSDNNNDRSTNTVAHNGLFENVSWIYDGTNLIAYINRNTAQSFVVSIVNTDTPATLTLGTRAASQSSYFVGNLSEFRIRNSSTDEINWEKGVQTQNFSLEPVQELNTNTPPLITGISWNSTFSTDLENLTCNLTAQDNESAQINISYTFFINGSNTTSGSLNVSNNTVSKILNLSESNFTAAYNYSCSAQAYDGTATSPLKNGANITITSSMNFTSRNPNDISSLNVVGTPMNISYNASSPSLDTTKVILHYKTNATAETCLIFVNGTCQNANTYLTIRPNITAGINYTFTLEDNEIYPAYYNLQEEPQMEQVVHNNFTLANPAAMLMDEFIGMNISPNHRYNIFEVNANGTGYHVYYCNTSYDNASTLTSNANCAAICLIGTNQPYNHTNSVNTHHMVCPYAINGTGYISTVKATSTGLFALVPITSGATVAYYVNQTSRIGATKTTTSTGFAWNNQTFTLDSHVHSYTGNESFWFYACENNSNDYQLCQSESSDLLDLGGVPPSIPFVYSPDNTTIYNVSIPINYTAAVPVPPDEFNITTYAISLINNDGSFNQTIIANNSPSLGYVFNSTNISNGFYKIRVVACDNETIPQCSTGFSQNITVQNFNYTVSSEAQAQIAYVNRSVNWTVNMTVRIGKGTCSYAPQKLALLNATLIYDASLNLINNTGNYTNASFVCNDTSSPYTLYFQTENNTENETTVSCPFGDDNQRRLFIYSTQNQSVNLNFTYAPNTLIDVHIFRCNAATNALCTCGASWTPDTFTFQNGTAWESVLLNSNESVFLVSWKSSSGGGGGGGGLPPSNGSTNNTFSNQTLFGNNTLFGAPPTNSEGIVYLLIGNNTALMNAIQNLPNLFGLGDILKSIDAFMRGRMGNIPNALLSILVLMLLIFTASEKKNTASQLVSVSSLFMAMFIVFTYGSYLWAF